MGTEEIVLVGLQQNLLRHGFSVEYQCAFRAEKDSTKLSFLKRCFPSSRTRHFQDNNDLHHESPKDVDGHVADRPTVQALFCGIVCKDISQLNNRPKSERQDGVSGTSLSGLLRYVEALRFEDRPKLIVLECVQRLAHRRAVDPDARTGTQYIADELASHGYVGAWQKVCPRDFFLPQSRPRVYGLFLRVKALGQGGLQQRQEDLSAALALVSRLKVRTSPHALSMLLKDSFPKAMVVKADRKRKHEASESPMAKRQKKRTGAPKWRARHQAWISKKGLSLKDLAGVDGFNQAIGDKLVERQREALWLKLCLLRKRTAFNWESGLVVATVGASVNWMGVTRNVFPCVTPQMSYILLDNGTPKVVDGLLLLALQGIQRKEVQRFKLNLEKDGLLRNLSGNAFTANILAAYIVAGLMYL
jgi:site-specific DNA-cytosine methylase